MKIPAFASTIIPRMLLNKLSYISDLHVADPRHRAFYKPLPRIKPVHGTLAICGDIGLPTEPRFREFFKQVASDYDHVLFVPGNHEYDCSSMFDQKKVDVYSPYLQDVFAGIPNAHLLDNTVFTLPDDTTDNTAWWVTGTTLWSNPKMKMKFSADEQTNRARNIAVQAHIDRHNRDVEWIDNTVGMLNYINGTNRVIVMSHFIPTMRLIEPKFRELGDYATSWFATDLETRFMYFNSPIRGWIAGHSHSSVECQINGVHCGLHAKHDV